MQPDQQTHTTPLLRAPRESYLLRHISACSTLTCSASPLPRGSSEHHWLHRSSRRGFGVAVWVAADLWRAASDRYIINNNMYDASTMVAITLYESRPNKRSYLCPPSLWLLHLALGMLRRFLLLQWDLQVRCLPTFRQHAFASAFCCCCAEQLQPQLPR